MQKVAVVVGAGPGAGAGIARRFAREGYAVALVSRSKETLQPIIEEIVKSGGQALAVPADTGSAASVHEAHETIVKMLGGPEVLVYNTPPGMKWPPPGILETDPEAFSSVFNPGVSGAFFWAQQVIPDMLKCGHGTILFTSGPVAIRGTAKMALLACPKAALRILSQCIAREFQPQGIHVAHIMIEGRIDAPRVRAMVSDKSTLLSPEAIAETYWQLHKQDNSAWTQELDLRPCVQEF